MGIKRHRDGHDERLIKVRDRMGGYPPRSTQYIYCDCYIGGLHLPDDQVRSQSRRG